MKSWTTTWMTEGVYDDEYKQYHLMAWLQRLDKEFNAVKLYPALDKLVAHHQTLETVFNKFNELVQNDERTLKGLDFKTKRLIFEQTHQPSALSEHLVRLTAFALPLVQKKINEGNEVKAYISSQLQLEPIGILPLYKNEGYLFLQNEQSTAISTYRFTLSMVELLDNHLNRLRLELIDKRDKGRFTTLAQFKHELTRRFKELPNPATFVLRSKLPFPERETLLPLGQRLLLREVL